MATKCDICEGSGMYPIFDKHGRERYSIECPECFGTGDAYEDSAADKPAYEYPASTAASIKSMDELRERFGHER